MSVDHLRGGRLAVEHLAGLGHRSVAFAGGVTSFQQLGVRLRGASQAAAEGGLSLTHVPTPGIQVEDGILVGRELAATPRQLRPTGVLCANDLVAIGLLQECQRQGISVPGELSIVGYDNLELAAAAAVPLTCVAQPRAEMGAVAARLLLDELDGSGHRHELVVLQPELAVRESTGPVRVGL